MKGEGSNKSKLNAIHRESVAWKSDLKFCKDEFNFFEKLLNSYEYVPVNKEDFEMHEDLMWSFRELRSAHLETYDRVLQHINNLSGVYDKRLQSAGDSYVEEHEAVKKQIRKYKSTFREFKEKLFALADRIMENKKQPDGPNS